MDQKIFENEADFVKEFNANKKEVCKEAVAHMAFKMLNSCVCAKETMEVMRYFNDLYYEERNKEKWECEKENASPKSEA